MSVPSFLLPKTGLRLCTFHMLNVVNDSLCRFMENSSCQNDLVWLFEVINSVDSGNSRAIKSLNYFKVFGCKL